MIKSIINQIKSLNMDITPWMENNLHLIKEKIYNNRKIILIIEKNKTDNYIGKFMIINYKKQLTLDDDTITWHYEPHMLYKTKNLHTHHSSREIKKRMEQSFVEVFLEKKIKLSFRK